MIWAETLPMQSGPSSESFWKEILQKSKSLIPTGSSRWDWPQWAPQPHPSPPPHACPRTHISHPQLLPRARFLPLLTLSQDAYAACKSPLPAVTIYLAWCFSREDPLTSTLQKSLRAPLSLLTAFHPFIILSTCLMTSPWVITNPLLPC